MSNADLLEYTASEMINTEIKRRKWKWIGHTLRREDNEIAKMALEWNPQGSRRPGRPSNTWMRTVHIEYSSWGTWQEVRRLARDRQGWREFVSALCSE